MAEMEDRLRQLEERVTQLEKQVTTLSKRAKTKPPAGRPSDLRDRYDALDYPER